MNRLILFDLKKTQKLKLEILPDLRAALVANCLRGALPPVDLRAVCLVRAIAIELS